MNEDYKIYEQIDLYLKGRLEGAELEAFRQQLASDPAFSQTVETQRVANRIIMTKKLAELKDQMSRDLQNDQGSGNSYRNLLISAGAGLVLIGSAVFFFSKNKKEEVRGAQTTKQEVLIVQKSDTLQTSILSPGQNNKRTISSNAKGIPALSDSNSQNVTVDNTPVSTNTEPHKSNQDPVKRDSIPVISTKPECHLSALSSAFDIGPACLTKNDGTIGIKIENVKGGKAPYLFSIDHGKHYSKNYIFRNLKADTYTIMIKDADQCSKEWMVEVPEKKCRETINDAFSPANGNWKIPVEDQGSIKIYNKNGVLVYSKDIAEGSEWDGKDNHGQLLEEGLYAFVIVYKNGSEQQGYISIMN
ncbi:MAG: gliding motility-associated C-terminal domain-containing protein [Cytophagaceae bacterium]